MSRKVKPEEYMNYDKCIRDDTNTSDAVSREAVLALAKDVVLEGWCKHRCIDATQIYELPPVTPKQRTGKWEKAITLGRYRCSVCKGEHNDPETGKRYEIFDTCAYNFCPTCGAKMEGESE